MKKVLSILSCLILTFILLCVAPNKVNAAEDTWYQTAANNAKNPVLLEDNQYFQGVSINSHIISDLTFMEIPFTDYLENGDKQVQVITFSEALYMKDGDILKEMVMYVYYPDVYIGDNDTIYTDIKFLMQDGLIGERYISILNNTDRYYVYNFKWTKVSEYDNIVKYSFGTLYQSKIGNRIIDSSDKPSINEWLLKDVGNNPNKNEVNTIFDLKISSFIQKKGIYSNELVENDGGDKWYKNQNMQFIYCKQNPLASDGIMLMTNTEPTYEHTILCVATNDRLAKVEGEVLSYRYLRDDAHNYIPFINYDYETEYFDVFYLFFNVFENDEKWGSEKHINELRLNYILANLFIESKVEVEIPGYRADATYNLKFLDSNGNVALTSSEHFNEHISNLNEEFVDLNCKYTQKFLNEISNDKLFIQDVIKPDTVKLNYLADSSYNKWVAFTGGDFDTRDVTYSTLFNTKSSDINKFIDSSNSETSAILNKYQFGAVVGNKKGYPVFENAEANLFGASMIMTRTLVAVAGVIDVEITENGEKHRVVISENIIDNSKVTEPGHQDEDPWIDVPGTPKPKDPENWLDKLIKFFTETLPKWWSENKTAVFGILITAGIVVAGIFIWKLLSPLITASAVKKAIKDEKKKE